MLAVAKGELDAYYLSDPDLMAQAAKNPDPNTDFLKSNAGQAPFTLWFNTQRKPLDDIRVRQALRHAIDNEAIARDLFGGLASPIHSYLPPFMFGYSEDVAKFPYNPDKARQLLKEANVPADWSPGVIGHSTLLISRRVIEAVAWYWNDVGVKATPELVEQAVINQKTLPKDFDIWGTYITRIDPVADHGAVLALGVADQLLQLQGGRRPDRYHQDRAGPGQARQGVPRSPEQDLGGVSRRRSSSPAPRGSWSTSGSPA